ncbi:MAG: asparagine synthase (glutamine-hydrolyzing) [Deltaproteobacteria bacterium]|nr:asparagine synthase (glutamine-hydrolyzing) [Deltaproteobacteria bacterium]
MCGIAGFIGKRELAKKDIEQTLALMQNRGPDNQAYLDIQDNDTRVYLLHSRLSIIDLEARSNQPFTRDALTVIFNGEIYNYLELRARLVTLGHEFITQSDTEVLLATYAEFGEECVNYFEGMWAFAVYDRNRHCLFISRDRFAEKPLYYVEDKDGFFFGSEIKFLRSLANKTFAINNNQVFRYLVNGYKSLYKGNETFFCTVKEVPYATNIVVTSSSEISSKRYWAPSVRPREMSREEAVSGIRDKLINSLRLRLRSDVPIAFCLSGGVDSGALVSIAKKCFNTNVHSFSIVDPDERYNELDNIETTVRDVGCRNTLIHLEKETSIDNLRALIKYHDSPISTISYYIHSFLSREISKCGYKVVISGTAADELFTGYYDHFSLHLYEIRRDWRFKTALADWQRYLAPIVRNPYLKNPLLYVEDPTVREHHYLNRDVFSEFLIEPFFEEFTENNFCDSLLRNSMLNELFEEVVPVILHEDDLNSMYYSLENRSPFLDTELFNFAYSIPTVHLIEHGYGKYLLREAMNGLLNDKVRLDRQKKGFNASVESVFDLGSADFRHWLLDDSPIYRLVSKSRIENLLKDNALPNSYSKFLFNFINSKLFFELY